MKLFKKVFNILVNENVVPERVDDVGPRMSESENRIENRKNEIGRALQIIDVQLTQRNENPRFADARHTMHEDRMLGVCL